MKVILSNQARSFLKKLLKSNKKDFERIIYALKILEKNPYAFPYVKIKGTNFIRIRVGDYRIVYKVEKAEGTVYIVKIQTREKVYKGI